MVETEDDEGGVVRAVVRAVDILKSFENATGPLTVAEIRTRVELSRPTLYRLLNTLVDTGMLYVAGNPQRYRLGRVAAKLGQIWAKTVDLDSIARPILDELRDKTGETSALFLLRDDRQFCVLESRSRQPLSMSRGIGEMDGFYGSSGKVILAWLPRDRVKALIAQEKGTRAPPIKSTELNAIRAVGHAVSHGAVFRGALSVAAPVFDRSGVLIGSIGLFGPEARMGTEHLPKIIDQGKASAISLSAELGSPL